MEREVHEHREIECETQATPTHFGVAIRVDGQCHMIATPRHDERFATWWTHGLYKAGSLTWHEMMFCNAQILETLIDSSKVKV